MAWRLAMASLIGAAVGLTFLWTTPLLAGPPLRWLEQVDSPFVRELAHGLGQAIGPHAKLWFSPILVIERLVPRFQEVNHRSGGVLAPLVMYLSWALAGAAGGLLTLLAADAGAHGQESRSSSSHNGGG